MGSQGSEMEHHHSINEFRIVMPMTVAEYQVGQLWSTAEASKHETGGGDGVEVLANEPFNDTYHAPDRKLFCQGKHFKEGQFTHKIYHMNRKTPPWLRAIVPKGLLELQEKSWNAYPFSRTLISNPKFMKDNFYIIIESFHANDNGSTPNIHGLSGYELQERKVVLIDIADNDKVSSKDYKAESDPCLVAADKAGRPAIPGDGTGKWMTQVRPVMCCYKLVRVWFKWFGMQKKMEHYILTQEHRVFFMFHRQVFCWLNNYYNLTMDDIRRMENEVKRDLQMRLTDGNLRGTTCTN